MRESSKKRRGRVRMSYKQLSVGPYTLGDLRLLMLLPLF